MLHCIRHGFVTAMLINRDKSFLYLDKTSMKCRLKSAVMFILFWSTHLIILHGYKIV